MCLLLCLQPGSVVSDINLGPLPSAELESFVSSSGDWQVAVTDEIFLIWNSHYPINYTYMEGCARKVYREGIYDVCVPSQIINLAYSSSVSRVPSPKFVRCRQPMPNWCAYSHATLDQPVGSCFALEAMFCRNHNNHVFLLPAAIVHRMHVFLVKGREVRFSHPQFKGVTFDNTVKPSDPAINSDFTAEQIAGSTFPVNSSYPGSWLGTNPVGTNDVFQTNIFSHSSIVTETSILQYNVLHQTYSYGKVRGVYSVHPEYITPPKGSYLTPSKNLHIGFWDEAILLQNGISPRVITDYIDMVHFSTITAPWPWNYFVDAWNWVSSRFWGWISTTINFVVGLLPLSFWVTTLLTYMRTANVISSLLSGLFAWRFGGLIEVFL